MGATTTTWRPALDGEAAVRARELASELAGILLAPGLEEVDEWFDGSVGRGGAGLALLYAELGDEENALRFVDDAIERTAKALPSPSLYSGSLGAGWVLAHLEGRLLGEVDLSDVDGYVAEALDFEAWPSVDLIRGVVGVGVYLLERLPSDRAATILGATVRKLRELGEATPDGVTWWVDPMTVTEERRERFPKGYYDIGVAHGNAGVVAFLAAAADAGIDGARELLGDATSWLLATRLPDREGPGWYPTVVAPEEHSTGGRLAWCYGDPGVAVGLLAAGRALGDDAVLAEATALALDCATRENPTSGTVDAGLCHGSAGLMQIFGRLGQQIGDERLYDAARFWFEDLLTRRTDDPLGGFPHVQIDKVVPKAGFLEGATGVALALLAASSDRDPAWDGLILTRPV